MPFSLQTWSTVASATHGPSEDLELPLRGEGVEAVFVGLEEDVKEAANAQIQTFSNTKAKWVLLFYTLARILLNVMLILGNAPDPARACDGSMSESLLVITNQLTALWFRRGIDCSKGPEGGFRAVVSISILESTLRPLITATGVYCFFTARFRPESPLHLRSRYALVLMLADFFTDPSIMWPICTRADDDDLQVFIILGFGMAPMLRHGLLLAINNSKLRSVGWHHSACICDVLMVIELTLLLCCFMVHWWSAVYHQSLDTSWLQGLARGAAMLTFFGCTICVAITQMIILCCAGCKLRRQGPSGSVLRLAARYATISAIQVMLDPVMVPLLFMALGEGFGNFVDQTLLVLLIVWLSGVLGPFRRSSECFQTLQ